MSSSVWKPKRKELDSQEVEKSIKQKGLEVPAQDFPEWLWSPPRSFRVIVFLPASESSSAAWGRGVGYILREVLLC